MMRCMTPSTLDETASSSPTLTRRLRCGTLRETADGTPTAENDELTTHSGRDLESPLHDRIGQHVQQLACRAGGKLSKLSLRSGHQFIGGVAGGSDRTAIQQTPAQRLGLASLNQLQRFAPGGLINGIEVADHRQRELAFVQILSQRFADDALIAGEVKQVVLN